MWVRLRVPLEDLPQPTAVRFQPVPLHAKILKAATIVKRRSHAIEKAITGAQKE